MSSLVSKVRHIGLLALLFVPFCGMAQDPPTDEQQDKPNYLTIDANLLMRGELRNGGMPYSGQESEVQDKDKARFIMSRTRLSIGYARSFVEAKVTAQHSGVWGQLGKGSFSLYEAWARLQAKNGLFAVVGRQELYYDDERILGRNDWAMAPSTHDALKLGYEGHGHKAHVTLAYNQKAENMNGGSIYRTNDGAVYKSMVTGWYHYDFQRIPLGASLLFMDMGLQNSEDQNPVTEHQQLLGAYAKFNPARWNVEAAYYRQMGTDEFHIPIKAWMASVKGDFDPNPQWRLTLGYDYLSGDPNPVVPKQGSIGLVQHTQVCGFNPLYGSHHQFYGAMDFFYVRAYYGGYTPGLQNWYGGVRYKPIKPLDISVQYHYLLTASVIYDADRTLGHELEFTASYMPINFVKVSAGYSYMHGSSTLERLQRVEGKNNLHWAWLMLTITPRILSKRW